MTSSDHSAAAGALCTDDGTGCCSTCGVSLNQCEECDGVGYHNAGCAEIEITAKTVTDQQIRDENRKNPAMIDRLMVAIHSVDAELRALARAEFADAINARAKADRRG